MEFMDPTVVLALGDDSKVLFLPNRTDLAE